MHTTSPQPWEQALDALNRQQVIGFPTETVWGLGVDAFSQAAVAALSRNKGRPVGKALQVCCASSEQARMLAAPDLLFEALLTLLPGPLTLVTTAAKACPAWLVFEGKVGLRVPDHSGVQGLLQRFGKPLATSSLNPAGQPPARSTAEARHYALAEVLLNAEPEAALLGLPSTVVDCQSAQILRQGALSAEHINGVIEQAWAQQAAQQTRLSTCKL